MQFLSDCELTFQVSLECAQATMPQLIKSYLVSYLANFAGSLLLVRFPHRPHASVVPLR